MDMPEEIAKAIGAKNNHVVFSADSAIKNKNHHQDLSEKDYSFLPKIGENPTIAIKDGTRTVVLVKQGESIYWAALKTTKTGAATFLTSFRKSNDSDVNRLLKKGDVIYGEWKK